MIHNLTKKNIISRSPFYATGFILRVRGMIGRSFTSAGFDAMVFDRCGSIHTLFMSEAIDVVFVDGENQVCGLRSELPPWRPGVIVSGAKSVIELPAGAINILNIEVGDRVDLNAEVLQDTVRNQQDDGSLASTRTKPVMPCKESLK
jgi:uncharacterized protein